MNQLISETNALGNSTNYTYDANGNRLTITDTNGNTTTFSYDALNRVEKTIYPDNTEEILSYDALGNLIAQTDRNGNTINYTYDTLNRMTIKTYPDTSTVNYSYNLNGNMLSANNSDISYTFTYDALNRVTQVNNVTLGKTVSYSYLCCGLKNTMTNPEGGVTTYTHGPEVDEVISTRRGGNSFFYLKDNLGSITSLTDNSESVVNTYEYDPFGSVISKTESLSNAYGYTGRRLDSESGLMYYRVRYYEPSIGRFITADPIGFSGGLNFYIYVNNNPVNLVDPNGLVPKPLKWTRIARAVCILVCFGKVMYCNHKCSKDNSDCPNLEPEKKCKDKCREEYMDCMNICFPDWRDEYQQTSPEGPFTGGGGGGGKW